MNDTIKLFDYNGKLVPNFDEEIEKILISIHGENYYDVDEELTNTNLITITEEDIYKDDDLEKTMELVDSMVDDDAKKITIVEEGSHKVGIKDFVPVLFFIIIAAIIIVAGYYFLNTADLLSLLGLS